MKAQKTVKKHRKRTPIWEGAHKLEVPCIQIDGCLVCNHHFMALSLIGIDNVEF